MYIKQTLYRNNDSLDGDFFGVVCRCLLFLGYQLAYAHTPNGSILVCNRADR